MTTIRFPNDDLVRRLMNRQDAFWRRLYNERLEKNKKETKKAHVDKRGK